jgi:CRP-like cAMP-binding protein
VSRLRAQRLFAGVSDDTIASASASVRFATFAPGDVISHHGDKDSPLVLLVSGRAQASRISENGREVGIAFARGNNQPANTQPSLWSTAMSRTPNDDRSDSMNPNNPAYEASEENRANQLNPNNERYQGDDDDDD